MSRRISLLSLRSQSDGEIGKRLFLSGMNSVSNEAKIHEEEKKEAPMLKNSSDYITQTASSQAQITPGKAISVLKEGNARFREGRMIQRDLMSQVKQTGSGQYPFAAVVSCIDSRIPTEIQGIGDIFNARFAGNSVNTDILGSLEFAAKVTGARAIVVMGHTECGAIKGACDGVELGNINGAASQP